MLYTSQEAMLSVTQTSETVVMTRHVPVEQPPAIDESKEHEDEVRPRQNTRGGLSGVSQICRDDNGIDQQRIRCVPRTRWR